VRQHDEVLRSRGAEPAMQLVRDSLTGLPPGNGAYLRALGRLRGLLDGASHRPRRTPALVLFFHLEKTGGTALREWLMRYSEPFITRPDGGGGFDRFYEYGESADCFRFLHPGLYRNSGRRGVDVHERERLEERCAPAGDLEMARRGGWADGRFAFEFHAKAGRRFYMDRVRPNLDLLRPRYAAHNGTVLSIVVLRDPAAHALSAYRMWPPMQPGPESLGVNRWHRTCVTAVPFPEWLEAGAIGLQTSALIGDMEESAGVCPRYELVGGRQIVCTLR